MEEDNNIKNFSAKDIERYHKGLMSSQEMHALEKAAMDDSFLADTLEGYSVEGVNVSNDLIDLQNRLAKRTGSGKMIALPDRKKYYWMKAAAMIVVVAGAGLLAYTLLTKNGKENNVAQVTKTKEDKKSPDLTIQDSNSGTELFKVDSSVV